MTTDSLGNALTLDDPAHRAAVDDFVMGFIACQSRAANVLQAAEDGSAYVQACCAAVQMFAETAGASEAARPFIERALAARDRATPREAHFVDAVHAWQQGDMARAVALHHDHARAYPRDLAALKLGTYHCFNLGDLDGMLAMTQAAHDAPGAALEVPYLHGMLAFGYEQADRLREAEQSARRAIAMRRDEPWAHHALGHVLLTEGRLEEGLAFMRGVADTWVGLNSFMVTHNWWHLALFLIELDRLPEALAVYDREVWGVAKDYSQDQVGAVSLLARLELAGADVGARWQDVADHLLAHVDDHVLPFLDLQYLLGLLRADRPQARHLLQGIEAHARDPQTIHREAWSEVAVPAARGIVALSGGDFGAAVAGLGAAMPQLVRIGGSHAQRDLFEQLYLEALSRSGRPEHLRTAQRLLEARWTASPHSVRLRRKTEAVRAALAAG